MDIGKDLKWFPSTIAFRKEIYIRIIKNTTPTTIEQKRDKIIKYRKMTKNLERGHQYTWF